MTDTEQNKIKAICEVAHVDDISDLSDGYHTFRQLYYQRMMLFAALVKQNRDKAWKSLRHEDGELCFGGGWFIVGIDTPKGSYTYHYEDNYFSLFDCKELERGKKWDGHTEKDVTRLLSLEHEPCGDCISRQAVDTLVDELARAISDERCCISRGRSIASIMQDILDLPSVEPERKKGKWILWNEPGCECVYCTVCKEQYNQLELYIGGNEYPNYCPNCGAKMEENPDNVST